MFNSLVLVHRTDGGEFRSEPRADWRYWQTCLRKLAFGSSEALDTLEASPHDQILYGQDAYRVCLEIICGLHSPLVGETEVFGQFKAAVDAWLAMETPLTPDLRKFAHALIEDAKKIRAQHLRDLGGQSYGSLLRKELRDERTVHILGGGHLVGEILPWLCKGQMTVHVHVRDVKRVTRLREAFPRAAFHGIHDLDQNLTPGSLIVAAPMKAEAILRWCGADRRFAHIFDLRGDSESDCLDGREIAQGITSLGELMKRISANQTTIASRRRLALDAIERLVAERARYVEYRPFGWEDVCA